MNDINEQSEELPVVKHTDTEQHTDTVEYTATTVEHEHGPEQPLELAAEMPAEQNAPAHPVNCVCTGCTQARADGAPPILKPHLPDLQARTEGHPVNCICVTCMDGVNDSSRLK